MLYWEKMKWTLDDNYIVTMLPEDNVHQNHVWQLDLDLAQKISKSSVMDPIITKALAGMHNENINPWLPWTTKEGWKFEDGNLYFKHCLYIPEEVWHQLVTGVHKSPARGHSGFFWTLHLLQKDYWWSGMSTFLRKFISGCALCQLDEVNTHPMVLGLTPLVVESSTPFSLISLISSLVYPYPMVLTQLWSW